MCSKIVVKGRTGENISKACSKARNPNSTGTKPKKVKCIYSSKSNKKYRQANMARWNFLLTQNGYFYKLSCLHFLINYPLLNIFCIS